ncbi:Hypothetical predicted protein [Mytilus galloprovincialis]|uniref:Uncharacterized protein n=1 Tax=Mytilus galloprovincialis TaxID=29158 RepID=A0A8B6EZ65_MYTGA|nr:Hypothetical predicted protein [Mytilus galloprovincialis]
MSNIDDQIAEISRQIQSLSESTIQHGQGFISSTPRGQGVRPKVVENKEHDSGVVTTGPSLSTPVGLAVGDTLPLLDRDIITNPQVNNRKSIGQDKIQNFSPKQESTKNQSTAHTVSSGSNDVKIKPSKYDGLTPWIDYLSHFEMCALVNRWSEYQKASEDAGIGTLGCSRVVSTESVTIPARSEIVVSGKVCFDRRSDIANK